MTHEGQEWGGRGNDDDDGVKCPAVIPDAGMLISNDPL